MKNNIYFILIIAALSSNNSIAAATNATTKEINVCVGSVQGGCVIGNVSIGEAKDKLSLDDSNITVQNLGPLKASKKIEVSLPLSGQKIIAFTPTEKNFANKQIKLLFYAFDLNNMPKGLSNPKIYDEAVDAKTKYPGKKTMLKVYYKLPLQAQWTEFLMSFTETSFANVKPSIMVDSSANIIYYPQKYTDENGNLVTPEPIVFDLNNMP